MMIITFETFIVANKVMLCANNYYRHYHFIIIDFKINYEKQILITKVKINQHCIICIILFYERKNLLQHWSIWNHESIKVQIARQFIHKIKLKHFDWVHSIKNFVWNHSFFNIYDVMLINILHQLHNNNMINYVLKWIRKLLNKHVRKSKRFKNDIILFDENVFDQLKRRFQLVNAYVDFKHFNHFNEIKQWIENEQKFILHQFVAMMTSLFISFASHVMLCVRTFINFVMLIHYRTHDDLILNYMKHALYRIQKLKNVFRESRKNKRNKKNHFNFLKFHILTHWIDHIKFYENFTNYDTAAEKTIHKKIKS